MANKADLHKFLVDVSQIFPVQTTRNKERLWELASNHLWCHIAKKEINYDIALSWLIDNHNKSGKNSYFPEIPTIAEALKFGEVKPYHRECVNEGSLLVVTLSSGFTYEFAVSGIGKLIDDLKADIKRKFGDCTYKFYPKGTVIIGSKVCLPES